MPGTGWDADVLEEVPATNPSRDLGLRGPLEQLSSLVATASVAVAAVIDVPTGTSNAHLDGMCEMLRAMGNVPDRILNSDSLSLIHI